jgi:hypothetical protein
VAFSLSSLAEPLAGSSPLADNQWETVREQVNLLDKIAHLPSLLPVIMTNRDALELSQEQLTAFRGWHKAHYQEMVGLMNDIIQRRIQLSKATLDTGIASDDIIADQLRILELQKRLLRLRLSCRDLIIEGFTPVQWDNLAFILEEYPRFAGLLNGR